MESYEIKCFCQLREATEKAIGRSMHTPRDFDDLSKSIYERVRINISAMTLKRFWGYLGEKNVRQPRVYTLNTLSQYIGYIDFKTFCEHSTAKGGVESDFIFNNFIYANALSKGSTIRVMWQPDRSILIRHEGCEIFTIVESFNSKLSVNDKFRCSYIIEGEPLYLNCLIHEGAAPSNYICGRIGGVKYHIINN